MPVPGEVAGVVNALRTESLAWVMPPFGEQYFVEEAVGRGLKLSFGCQTWKWAARPDPEPERESVRYPPPPGARVVANVEGIHILSWEGRAYATLARADGLVVPCAARGAGGHLDEEFSFSGRTRGRAGSPGWMDGRRSSFLAAGSPYRCRREARKPLSAIGPGTCGWAFFWEPAAGW